MARDEERKAQKEEELKNLRTSSWKKFHTKPGSSKAYMLNQSTECKVLKKSQMPAQDRLKRLQKRLEATKKDKSMLASILMQADLVTNTTQTTVNIHTKKFETKDKQTVQSGTNEFSEKANSVMESAKLKTLIDKPKQLVSDHTKSTETKRTVNRDNICNSFIDKPISLEPKVNVYRDNIFKLTTEPTESGPIKTHRKSLANNREKPYDISKRIAEISNVTTCTTLIPISSNTRILKNMDNQNGINSNNTTAEIYKLKDNCSSKELIENFLTPERIRPLHNAANPLDQLRYSLTSKITLARSSDAEKVVDNASTKVYELESMDWECSDIDTKIESNTHSVVRTLPETMGEYYDEINHNLMRLTAEKTKCRDSLNSKWLKKRYYFVVDTNVFLRNLTFIDELCAMKLCDTIGSIIYVPYMVLQELDKLKMREPTVTLATRAIRYLNRKFEETNFQAQSALEEKNHLIVVNSADDSIINCCLQVQVQVDHVLLLTEDVNLHNKAYSNNLLVSNKSDLISMKPSSSLK